MDEMKKYNSLSELISDYREAKNLTQLDLAARLNVDVKTIGRWENGLSLIKPDKEDDVMEALFLPHQVIHNLNSEHPISIYYDIETRTYSFSLLGSKMVDSEMFRSNLPVEEERIHPLSDEDDVEFINAIQANRSHLKPLGSDLILMASKTLPELNMILFDQAGFYAGHTTFLPLNENALEKLRNKEIGEYQITSGDIENDPNANPKIFYFYSLYGDSITNLYYLISRVLRYFKMSEFENYIIAGMTYHPEGIKAHREMGLKVIWEEEQDVEGHPVRSFLEGNYDMYLFGKTR